MKIAVIGGNLLGCATTLDLALVQEHDKRKFPDSTEDPFSVTLFEQTPRLGGNSFKSIPIDDSLRVEVGTHRTLSPYPNTFLSDLIATATDTKSTISVFNRRIPIPGYTQARRGSPSAIPKSYPWRTGSNRRAIRTFAAWDWHDNTYHLRHRGLPLLDFLHKIFDNHIWRSLALVALLWKMRQLNSTNGIVPRAIALAQVVQLLFVFVLSPRVIISYWQRQYAFWATTLPLLYTHGITPAIARGSSIGFIKHLGDMNSKNAATCSVSLDAFVKRTGLDTYIRGSGEDFVRKFQYNRNFVDRYLAPIVGWQYAGANLNEVSSLAVHFALLDGDFCNLDVTKQFCTIQPENAAICPSFIEAARKTMPVEVNLATKVTAIVLVEASTQYRVSYGNGQSDLFDGIVMCASPMGSDITIETSLGSCVSELFGYERNAAAAEEYTMQEAEYIASTEGNDTPENMADPQSCSHFAVVVGCANPNFFRLCKETDIPDLVQITRAPGVSRFERIRGVLPHKPGVYTILCGSDLQSSGLIKEMFHDGAEIRYFQPTLKSKYKHCPVPEKKSMDQCVPYMVLGNRFVYAAATDSLADHPEIDAISAVNASSLFSKVVEWSDAE